VAERAEYLRIILGELTRIVNHLLHIGFLFNELGAMMTPMIYASLSESTPSTCSRRRGARA